MKVVLLAPTPPPAGGIAGWTLRMMHAKLKEDWTVTVVDEKVIGGREVFGSASKRNLVTEWKRCCNIWRNLKLALKDPEVAVVHSCIPSATLSMMREYVCACITKHSRKKFIIHFRCTVPNTTKGRVGKFVLKRLCQKSDMIIALNKQTYIYLQGVTNTPITLIPNFTELREINRQREIHNQVRRVLYVGGVIVEKGCLDMIRVAKAFPNIEFRMVGKIDEKIFQVAKEVKNVVLTGPKDREGVQVELADADVFMFLSYFTGEGFSNALAEAMAAGLPCIASDWAANADMIENQGGIVVPIQNPEITIVALRNIFSGSIRKQQSEFNIEKAKSVYSDSVVLSQYVDCYKKCLRGDI